ARADDRFDGPPVNSFSALQSLLISGDHLIVRDSSGRTTKGRFVSLSGGQLEIIRRRWNFRTERRSWREDAVARIKHEDPTWDGGILRAAVGVAAVVLLVKSPSCDMRCLPFAAAAVPVGMWIGDSIDGSINRTVYESLAAPRVTVLSPPGTPRARVSLSYRF